MAVLGKRRGDIEAGQLYPNMVEDVQFRWAFIRKVYVIIAMQMILTAAVAAVVVFVPPIPRYLVSTRAVMCPLYAYMKRHPINFILLGLFTVAIAFGVGMSCAFVKGKIVLEALILTCVVVVSLTLYTFWAAKRGKDFSFLGPFLFAGMMVLMVFMLIQIFIPLGKLSLMIYGCISAILFSAYIVYDTDNLIKRYSYDEYIPAAVTLYLDIVNLFLALLALLEGADS
uniref:BI1-like protein n=1 Tax=Chenopodium quinoa TaxID=63459 RepID=A0A803M6L5_CHEQI